MANELLNHDNEICREKKLNGHFTFTSFPSVLFSLESFCRGEDSSSKEPSVKLARNDFSNYKKYQQKTGLETVTTVEKYLV